MCGLSPRQRRSVLGLASEKCPLHVDRWRDGPIQPDSAGPGLLREPPVSPPRKGHVVHGPQNLQSDLQLFGSSQSPAVREQPRLVQTVLAPLRSADSNPHP